MTDEQPVTAEGQPHDSVIRIVLADDHAVVRAGLRLVLGGEADMRVVGEAADGIEAIAAASNYNPDVLIMDISMPGLGGVEATTRVRQECPSVRVLGLSVHEERTYLTQLLRAGATGYVLKRSSASEIVRAVRTVAAGGTYVDQGLTSSLVESYLDVARTRDDIRDGALSHRERDVLLRIARGFSNKEIASALRLSVKTVETYKSRVGEKLNLRTRVDIVRYAARRGWLDDSPPDRRQ